MSGTSAVAGLVDAALVSDAEPSAVRRAVQDLLAVDAAAGVDLVLGLLSRPPRIKPSRGLLVDPTDAVGRAWDRRVAAAAALVASPALLAVYEEVVAELAESDDLAREVLTGAATLGGPAAALAGDQRDRLAALGRQPPDDR